MLNEIPAKHTKHTALFALGIIVLFTFLVFYCDQLEANEIQAKQSTITLQVEKMTCAMCPITIRKSLENIDGVIKADVSFDTKLAIVNYDPTKTNVKALIQATTNTGYPSTEYSSEKSE